MTLPKTTRTSTRRRARRALPAVTGVGLTLMLALTGCDGVTVETGSAGAEAGAGESTASDGGQDGGGAEGGGGQEGGGEGGGQNGGGEGDGAAGAGGGEGAAGNDGARCRASELKVGMQEQPTDAKYKVRGMLMITNKGERDCVLPAGFAAMGVKTAGGDHISLPTVKENYPGAGVKITLRPGTTAYEGSKWESGPGDCSAPLGFGVSWYGTWIPVESSWLDGAPRALCGNSMTQGTVQPIRNGVNFR